MEATIGQPVRLYLNGGEAKTWNGQSVAPFPGADYFAAIIAFAHGRKQTTTDSQYVNVAAWDHFGDSFTVGEIPLVGPDVQMPADGKPFARWIE